MDTNFKVGDTVYVEIISVGSRQLLYRGEAIVKKIRGGARVASVIVRGVTDTQDRYVNTDGTDGDVIRYPTKLDKYLWGEK